MKHRSHCDRRTFSGQSLVKLIDRDDPRSLAKGEWRSDVRRRSCPHAILGEALIAFIFALSSQGLGSL
jgi:hypothetical protein